MLTLLVLTYPHRNSVEQLVAVILKMNGLNHDKGQQPGTSPRGMAGPSAFALPITPAQRVSASYSVFYVCEHLNHLPHLILTLPF